MNSERTKMKTLRDLIDSLPRGLDTPGVKGSVPLPKTRWQWQVESDGYRLAAEIQRSIEAERAAKERQ